MSINIATLGMFRDCCGGQVVGGGAPPTYFGEQKFEKEEKVLVSSVYFEEINIKPQIILTKFSET